MKKVYPLVAALAVTINCFAVKIDFQGLGDLPGGDYMSWAIDVSSNGYVIVGFSDSSTDTGFEGFRWQQTGGLMGLGSLAGSSYESSAGGVSADGLVVVGSSDSFGETEHLVGTEAFRWTESEGMVGLGDLSGGDFYAIAMSASADGSIITGWGNSSNGTEAFRWTESEGMIALGDLPGGTFYSKAEGVNADGTVIAGYSISGDLPEAFRWTDSEGMVGLGFLPGASFSIATDISADGKVIVGDCRGNTNYSQQAFGWTESGGMFGLGDLPGGQFRSEAYGANADGSRIVGAGISTNGQEAFLWEPNNGMQNLKSVLVSNGVDLAGWTLTWAFSISDDGRTIVGFGTNPQGAQEAWRATLIIDLDKDGMDDDWEIQQFGSIEACLPGGDPDGDQYTNIEEHNNDTDPNTFDVGSLLHWPAIEMGWKTVSGTNYQLQCSTALESNVWENVGPPVVGVDGTNGVLISTRDAAAKFYRVIIVPSGGVVTSPPDSGVGGPPPAPF